MTLEKRLAKIFNLNDENWMRHSNPLSVWTRFSVLPIILLAFWSRTWIGTWHYLFVLISIVWMFVNPVLFNKPKSTKNWASKAVLGERVYLNRDKIEIPKHHQKILNVTNLIAFSGLPLTIYGVIHFLILPTVFGVLLTYIGKSWFLDRMVWLFEEMKDIPKYKKWLY